MKTFQWLVKREFWEHRGGFFWAPVITAIVFLVLNLMALITAETMGRHHGFTISAGNSDLNAMFDMADAGHMRELTGAMDGFMMFSVALVLVVTGFVVLFYCLGSLYDDRRDRSVLFWKSLPISDASTVLSKVFCAALLAPCIAVAVGLITGILQLLIFTVALSLHGINAWEVLTLAHPFRALLSILSLIPLTALWALPAIGWLMLCSAWARSKPFLWAVALPTITGLMLGWFNIMGLFGRSIEWFWTEVFLRIFASVFPGSFLMWHETSHHLRGIDGAVGAVDDGNPLIVIAPANTYGLLTSANLWIGVVVGVAMLAGAVWLRRTRDDS